MKHTNSFHPMLVASLLLAALAGGCGDSVKPEKTTTTQPPKPYEQNAVDAVGVAEGNQQVSPFGKPASGGGSH